MLEVATAFLEQEDYGLTHAQMSELVAYITQRIIPVLGPRIGEILTEIMRGRLAATRTSLEALRPATLARRYEEASGRPVGDLRWPMAYAAIRHGVIMRRVGERMVLFGEREPVDDPEELILHRTQLRAMLDGTYWDDVDL